ncbi:primosomal protein N' [Actimicrobium sp. CCC2.4]|uniref:primosomal protein N' n=1 Tax=Actimicrobium sp. CCC2.4 TaxID=3048606 RepID=UPI002AC97611|nr:primosomal protein N' [Actimicrobium sp. CCC2.4]WPX32561.1 primosomal protein N' [Actimicrobium sp. CCC2.4]
MSHCILTVALDAPLAVGFDYLWPLEVDSTVLPAIGQIAIVPFGRREVAAMIVGIGSTTEVPAGKLKNALAVHAQLPPLSSSWLALCRFAAAYYHRPLGEVVIPALPKNLRGLKSVSLDKALKKLDQPRLAHDATPANVPALNPAQQYAADAIAGASGYAPHLLYGVTGSGKTEVYLHAAATILSQASDLDNPAQILIMVPEINLTPQLEGNIRARFPTVMVVTLHSGLAEGERLRNWLAAHLGHARIILGTRLALLASIPHLKLIMIDEEHDTSYKQQEGLRYSARDLAVWRARQLAIPLVLGSATPSLETWHHAQSGRYRQLDLRDRAVRDAVLPKVSLINMEHDKPFEGITSTLLKALKVRLERGEQSLLFLNRRGYAPVLSCDACGWISNCTRCTAFMVLHKPDYRLRCHHCGLEHRIPKSCPTCGNVDIQPLGRGTQRVEEGLQSLLPEARLLRIDADSTRRKGSAQAAFDSVHRGDVDILIGTQMVAKGHDFQNLTLVGILNPDTALFSQDYRASERLFAQLMQVAGRAGRAAQKDGGSPSEVLIQTRYPQHPLYAAIIAHNYDRFANELLAERRQAGLPPYIFQALLRAEARELPIALEFLRAAAAAVKQDGIVINDPIPMTMMRVANVDRAQLLIESASRPALQAFLTVWIAALREIKTRARWSVEVDPADI